MELTRGQKAALTRKKNREKREREAAAKEQEVATTGEGRVVVAGEGRIDIETLTQVLGGVESAGQMLTEFGFISGATIDLVVGGASIVVQHDGERWYVLT